MLSSTQQQSMRYVLDVFQVENLTGCDVKPPSYHRANQVQVLRTGSTTKREIWQYDTCCTDDMTNNQLM